MTKKRKKKRRAPSSVRPLKKSLRQSTHPIPPEKVEESKATYDRRRSREEAEDEVDRELGEG